MLARGVEVSIIDRDIDMIRSAEALTAGNTGLNLTVAANYGGRWDILQAMERMLKADPSRRDPALNLYDPRNPDQPPYAPAFVSRFRAAQLDRNRRITSWVRETLEDLVRFDI